MAAPSNYGLSRQRAPAMLRDEGVIQDYTPGTQNVYGYKGARPGDYADRRKPIACNYVPQNAAEAPQTLMQVPTADAVVYFPADTVIGNRERFKLTKRNKRRLAKPVVHQVIGEPEPGGTLLKVELKLVVEKTT